FKLANRRTQAQPIDTRTTPHTDWPAIWTAASMARGWGWGWAAVDMAAPVDMTVDMAVRDLTAPVAWRKTDLGWGESQVMNERQETCSNLMLRLTLVNRRQRKPRARWRLVGVATIGTRWLTIHLFLNFTLRVHRAFRMISG